MLETWIGMARARSATDIHCTIGESIAFRINGSLTRDGSVLTTEIMQQVVLQLNEQVKTKFAHKTPRDAFNLIYVDRLGGRSRVHMYRHNDSYSLAIRLIPEEIRPLSSLVLPPVVETWLDVTQGLVLVTGSTGAGKTTTLASFVEEINVTRAKHIVSLEDPIEYRFRSKQSLIHQRQIERDTPSFETGLLSALRADPDVILMGETSETSTMRHVLRAAETGHLVLSTMHAGGAAAAIERVIDMFAGAEQASMRMLLASVLVGIIAQRWRFDALRKTRHIEYELLVNTPAIANLIRTQHVHQIPSVMQMSFAQGMRVFDA